jgi:HAD superfamily hydrolase (TIGR01509 family)
VVPVSRDLPVERGPVSPRLEGLVAITLDFGNTLVPVDRVGLGRVVERTASQIEVRSGPFAPDAFLAAWTEERDRQFAEALPSFREIDLRQRVVRVLARLRGFGPPPLGEAWDDAAAARRSTPDEVDQAIEIYSHAFVAGLPPRPDVGPLLARLAGRFRLAVLSNWPLAVTIDRYVEAAGWASSLRAVIVSERVGTIKPHPTIFAAARAALGDPAPDAILHVGDDWAADVVGAKAVGWRAAHLTGRPVDSPLPSSRPDEAVTADLVIDRLEALEAALG